MSNSDNDICTSVSVEGEDGKNELQSNEGTGMKENLSSSTGTVSTSEVRGLKTDPQTCEPIGCDHYRRLCAIICPDKRCSQVFVCRLCHDDEINDHSLNRHDVNNVVCLNCSTIQDANSQSCQSCKVQFATYFCKVCHLYDFKDKKQFHCDDCGICRVGGRSQFFHCDKCTICLNIELKGNHTCVENAGKNNCPVCMEDLHSSVNGAKPLKCGHMIHLPCFKDMVQAGCFTCPICNKSVDDMSEMWRNLDDLIAHQPMPNEYNGVKSKVQCRDCNKAGVSEYHYVGLKCPFCGSYNTTDEGFLVKDEENEGGQDDMPANLLVAGDDGNGDEDDEAGSGGGDDDGDIDVDGDNDDDGDDDYDENDDNDDDDENNSDKGDDNDFADGDDEDNEGRGRDEDEDDEQLIAS